MSKLLWFYRRLTRKLWYRASLYCVIGIFAALMAKLFGPMIPQDFPKKVGADAVEAILTIIASSMLVVTTFSLTTMVSATAAASQSATPRVTKLLVEDTTAQRALSTFLGAFLFSLVGLIALKTGLYDDGGRLVLLAATLGVILVIVVMLLKWINHLSMLGRMGETISTVETAVTKAMCDYSNNPLFGGQLYDGMPPPEASSVSMHSIGYIEHLNMSALSTICKDKDADIYVSMRPGEFAVPSRAVAHVQYADANQKLDDDTVCKIQNAFTMADSRSFDQDPRFGLIVLCEIALRAMSPAVNDPGTAIQVIGTQVRVLSIAARAKADEDKKSEKKCIHPRVHVPELAVRDFIDDAFLPLTRDAATNLEVSIKLQKACDAIATLDEAFREVSYDLARLALRRAIEAMPFEPDRIRLKAEASVELPDDAA